MNLNRQEFTGYLGKFGETAVTKKGKRIYTNTFAIVEYNAKTKESKFINFKIVAFDKVADNIALIPEKAKVMIFTHLSENAYQNKEGKNVKELKFIVDDAVLWELPSLIKTDENEAYETYGTSIDDLPF